VDARKTWLVAAWPGMGAVGVVAVQFLARVLDAQPEAELPADRWFEAHGVTVKEGVLSAAPRPRTRLLRWRNPRPEGADLLLLVGEAQPPADGWGYCEFLWERLAPLGISRVITFAAMASPSDPGRPARVFAAATSPSLIRELDGETVEPLEDGEIGGLNGVLLGVAAAHGVAGLCLLGEFPLIAQAFPNPKASAAVLRVFSRVSRIPLDLAVLDAEGERMERTLIEWIEKVRASQAERSGEPDEEGTEPALAEPKVEPRLRPEDAQRIERLFAEAALDRSKALTLKAELDRLGAFHDYEDRFLDLFKRAE
jgi:proteasome assembly chaperone (PAC2) family protein